MPLCGSDTIPSVFKTMTNRAGERTRLNVWYAHESVPAFGTASGGAVDVPAGHRRIDSSRRVLVALPTPPKTDHAPTPGNRVENAPRCCCRLSSPPPSGMQTANKDG